jgi:hypothetical protein
MRAKKLFDALVIPTTTKEIKGMNGSKSMKGKLLGAIAATTFSTMAIVVPNSTPAAAATGITVNVSETCDARTNRATTNVSVTNWNYVPGWIGRARVSYWDVNNRRWAAVGSWGIMVAPDGLAVSNFRGVLPDGVYSQVVEVQSTVSMLPNQWLYGPNLPITKGWTNNYGPTGSWFPAAYCYV